jgi:hypothetical protein
MGRRDQRRKRERKGERRKEMEAMRRELELNRAIRAARLAREAGQDTKATNTLDVSGPPVAVNELYLEGPPVAVNELRIGGAK